MANTTAARPQPAAAPPASRMTLANIRSGRRRTADRILLAGTEGVGKTTWAADAPSPVFIPAEDGIGELDVKAYPKPTTFAEVLDAIRDLRRNAHDFKTVAIDTVDAVEPLIWSHLCRRHSWDTLEDPGFGKGYNMTGDVWRELLAELEALQVDKGMHVILLAHTTIKKFSNPAGQDFDRYEIKLHRIASALIREWTHANLFAMYEEFAKKERGELKVKGIATGRRIVHTVRTAAWDAKNRYNLPSELPLNYADYAEARDRSGADPAKLLGQIAALLAELAPEPATRAKIDAAVQSAGADPIALAKHIDRIQTLIQQKGE